MFKAADIKERLHKSQAERLKERYADNDQLAMQILRMKTEDYLLYRIESAKEFLNMMLAASPELNHDEILASDRFWDWFDNQWNLRTDAFITQHCAEEMVNIKSWIIDANLYSAFFATHFLALMSNQTRNSFMLVVGDIIRDRFNKQYEPKTDKDTKGSAR